MGIVREFRKGVGKVFGNPVETEKIKELEKKVNFLYQFLNLNMGERQYATRIEDIDQDHIKRYEFARQFVEPGFMVADAACGVGYGSYLLGEIKGVSVKGFDISEEAIAVARQFWSGNGAEFQVSDCTNTGEAENSYDVAVSFETIEHIPDPENLLGHLYRIIKPDGLLICSSPNEDVVPHNPKRNKHHYRHYRPSELTVLIESSGFRVEKMMSQGRDDNVVEDDSGSVLCVLARADK